jgi:serine/threonine protein kinase
MAPECVKQKANSYTYTIDEIYITQKADVWALGCILFELISGVTPFASNNNNRNKVFRQVMESYPKYEGKYFENVSPELVNFISRCLVKDAEKRPSSIDLAFHPWLAQTDDEDLIVAPKGSRSLVSTFLGNDVDPDDPKILLRSFLFQQISWITS